MGSKAKKSAAKPATKSKTKTKTKAPEQAKLATAQAEPEAASVEPTNVEAAAVEDRDAAIDLEQWILGLLTDGSPSITIEEIGEAHPSETEAAIESALKRMLTAGLVERDELDDEGWCATDAGRAEDVIVPSAVALAAAASPVAPTPPPPAGASSATDEELTADRAHVDAVPVIRASGAQLEAAVGKIVGALDGTDDDDPASGPRLTRSLKCVLTPDELAERSTAIDANFVELERLDRELDKANREVKAIKSSIEHAHTMNRTRARERRDGYVYRSVVCVERRNLKERTMETIRVDTGELVEPPRPLRKDELQGNLFEEAG